MPTLIDTDAAMDETAENGRPLPNDGAERRARSTSPMSAIGDGTCPIRLDGIYKHIEPVIATQRENFAKIIHGCCREMLEHDRDIRRRLETLKKFESKYRDKDDLDDQNRPKEKSYIPVSLRNKLSISCSPLVQKDGRCSQELAEIQTVQERARSTHETYQASIASELKLIAEIELKARRRLFCHSYIESIVTIAEGIVVIAKNQAGRRPIEASAVSNVAKVAAYDAINAFAERESNRWRESRFIPDGAGDGALIKFQEEYVAHHNMNDAMIARASALNSAEREIKLYVARKLGEWWPILTHRLWSLDVKRDTDKKLDSELTDLFKSKAIVKANKNLADAMESGTDETVLPIIQKTVRREMAKKASANKKASRKKSSGDSKSQESTPKRSGRSKHETSKDASKQKPSKSNQPSKKKSSDDEHAADDDKSTASNESKKRGRSKSQPRSILKNAPKVTFKKTRGRSSSKRNRGSSKSRSAASRDGSSSGESPTEGNEK
jgi:hypothetical protein